MMLSKFQVFYSWKVFITIAWLISTIVENSIQCMEGCSEPSFVTKPPSTTEWEAEMEAKCFTACVDLYETVCNQCNINISLSFEDLKLWNTFRDHSTNNDINCLSFQKISDCQRGCMIKATTNLIASTNSTCEDMCVDKCPDKYDSITCQPKCSFSSCGYGCQIYDKYLSENNSITNSPDVYSPPYEPFVVNGIGDRDGLFTYSTSHGTLPSSEGSGVQVPIPDTVSFVFKIKTRNHIAYIWKWTYYGRIDLGFGSCQEMNISFKAVSKYSSSMYSPIQTTCGELQYPQQVNIFKDVGFYFTEDFRPGYERHAIVNISWSKPPGAQFLDNYLLTVFSQKNGCGGFGKLYDYVINRDATSFSLVADDRSHPFFFGCQYFVKLISVPNIQGIDDTPYRAINAESISLPSPTIDIKCTTQQKANGKFDAYVVWTISEYPGIIEAIAKYTLHPQKMDHRRPVPTIVDWLSIIDIVPNVNKTINAVVVPNMEPLEEDYKYHLRVDAVSNDQFPWRQMPRYVTCIVDAFPQPSHPVNSSSVDIIDLDFNQKYLFLNMTWEFPDVLNGIATKFEVRIAREYLEPTEIDDPTDYSLRQHSVGNSTTIVINVTQLETIHCLYLQIRCENNYNLWSNWSDPIVIKKYPVEDPGCTGILLMTPPTFPPATNTTKNDTAQSPCGSGTSAVMFTNLMITVISLMAAFSFTYGSFFLASLENYNFV